MPPSRPKTVAPLALKDLLPLIEGLNLPKLQARVSLKQALAAALPSSFQGLPIRVKTIQETPSPTHPGQTTYQICFLVADHITGQNLLLATRDVRRHLQRANLLPGPITRITVQVGRLPTDPAETH